MSRRRRRNPRPFRYGTTAPLGVGDVLQVVLYTLLGLILASTVGTRFHMPAPVNRDAWQVVSPGLDESIRDPSLGRGVYIEDGALTLRQHAFHRTEILSPRTNKVVRRVALTVESGVIRLNIRGPHGSTFANLGADQATVSAGEGAVISQPPGTPWVVEVGPTEAVLVTEAGRFPIGAVTPDTAEISAYSDEARVRRAVYEDADGKVILDANFADTENPRWLLVVGAVLGALFGFVSRLATRERRFEVAMAETLLLTVPILSVCAVGGDTWLFWVERAYLARTPAWGLAQFALAVAAAPALVLAVLRLGVLRPADIPERVPGVAAWVAVAAIATLTGALHGGFGLEDMLIGPLVFGFLVMPLRWVRRAALPVLGALRADLPAFLAVAVLGMGWGLLFALLWRFLGIWVAAGEGVLRSAPRPVTDQLFVMLLLVPLGLEGAVRSSYLDEAWDISRLSGDLAPNLGWEDPSPFWAGACGRSAPESSARRILWMGGSSTGGAYQFRDEMTAFYPSQVHQRLCDAQNGTVRLRSENYGDGGRDTYTISRSLRAIADREPVSLVVLYVGVNDILTMSGPKTRAQREADRAARDAATSGLAAWGARSRLMTGLGLWVRPLHTLDEVTVPEVPLPDAEANLRMVAKIAEEHGASVLLLTELVRGDAVPILAPYAKMQARLADALANVAYVDIRSHVEALGPWSDQDMLVDQNHLSRAGSARVAAALAPEVARLLSISAPAEPDLTLLPAHRISTATPPVSESAP